MHKTLVKMDLHNTFKEHDADDVTSVRAIHARVDPFLHPLFTELSKKRPTWHFITKNLGSMDYNTNYWVHNHFHIEEDGEMLGRVWVETHWQTRKKKFAFDNQRLRDSRRRGNATETKDLKKAVKTILANMYPTTPSEFLAAQRPKAGYQLSAKVSSVIREYEVSKHTALMGMEHYVLDNAEMLKEQLPFMASVIDRMVEKRELANPVVKVDQLIKANKSVLVAVRGDKYYVEPAADLGTFTCYTVGELPDYIKRAVGALRLTETDTLLPEIGFRVDDNVFVVFDE